MKIKSYVQSCPDNRGKIISGLKKATVNDAIMLFDHAERMHLKQEDVRPMHLTIEESDEKDFGRGATVYLYDERYPNEYRHSLKALDYMRIILGYVPGWQLIQAEVNTEYIDMVFMQFGDDEDAWFAIQWEISLADKIRIDLAQDEEHPAETYYISRRKGVKVDDLVAVVSYYLDGQMQYTSEIEVVFSGTEDDPRCYHLEHITEA